MISKSSLKKDIAMYNAYDLKPLREELQNINKPFFCVVNKNLIITDIYIPEKRELGYLKDYLDIVIPKVNDIASCK